ncbi:MAG: uroporphyrinogen decarboxylase family protein [Bacillota bacterium]
MQYNLDVNNFWEVNKKCFEPFTTDKPRVPLTFWLDDHFIFEEMGIESTLKYYNNYDYQLKMNKLCNQKTKKILGKKFYSEDPIQRPSPRRFEVIMGSHWEYSEGGTPWLESTVENIDDVKALISKAVKLDMEEEAFPENWQEKKDKYEEITGKKIKIGGSGSRGPATMATSILGTTNTCMYIMDEPDVMDEFFNILGSKLIEYHKVLMEDTGKENSGGYSLTDDNSYLFPPAQYERFCAPFLEKIFSEFAPEADDKRFQHSDSAMGHLMPILKDLGINGVNLGPSISPEEIRKAMPDTVIHGQIPPFTLRNGSAEEIIETVKRDINTVGQDGGLVECPAGSVAGGTPLENLKIYMWAVETYGQY